MEWLLRTCLRLFINGLTIFYRELLISFRRATGQKPLRIIFYRFVSCLNISRCRKAVYIYCFMEIQSASDISSRWLGWFGGMDATIKFRCCGKWVLWIQDSALQQVQGNFFCLVDTIVPSKYWLFWLCRDGVSEGQFYQVLLYELDAIRKACASLEPDYQPPVTFVVVQKRHHTRLFACNHNDSRSIDRSGNILPG